MNSHFAGCRMDGKCRCEIKRYWLIAVITAATLAIEIIGGLVSGSLSLVSDAFHVGIDLTGVLIALGSEYWVISRPGDGEKKIRGIGGIISGIALFVSTYWIFFEAAERIFSPKPVRAGSMILFALIGLIGNAIAAWVLHGGKKHTTHQALSAHIISDLAQSIGVVGVGIFTLWTKWSFADPIASIVITALLLRLSYLTVRRSWDSLQ